MFAGIGFRTGRLILILEMISGQHTFRARRLTAPGKSVGLLELDGYYASDISEYESNCGAAETSR
jgi:hypothetical protein